MMQSPRFFNTTSLALLIFAALWACLAATFPAFPVDETRYLTVAWEMRHGNWILPTLNGEPYSHKPPLLFWLINIAWLSTGPSVWAARLISLLVASAVIILTAKMARVLFPDRPLAAQIAPLLLVACPPFMLYGNMIMFDFLLYLSALGSLLFLWKAAHDRSKRSWILFGAMMGIGVLAKGPVILVHILGPALLAPFLWLRAESGYTKAAWYKHVLLGILIATAIGLAWAIPAAIIGGPDFAHMIFWGQSAGRMVNAFDHKRPFFFYMPFIFAFMLPWMMNGAFWRSLIFVKNRPYSRSVLFLLSWIVPAFLAFCAISGKQVHYLVPLTSALALIVAAAMSTRLDRDRETAHFPAYAVFYALAFCALAFGTFLPFIRDTQGDQVLTGISHFEHWPFLIGAAIALLSIISSRGMAVRQIAASALCLAVLMGIVSIEGKRHFYDLFDLRPVGSVIYLQEKENRPLAFAPKYAGEIGFAAMLHKPVATLEFNEMDEWLKTHPNGVVIIRHENYQLWPQYRTIYSTRYKSDQRISLIKAGN